MTDAALAEQVYREQLVSAAVHLEDERHGTMKPGAIIYPGLAERLEGEIRAILDRLEIPIIEPQRDGCALCTAVLHAIFPNMVWTVRLPRPRHAGRRR